MERSAIRDRSISWLRTLPGFASLHPGYNYSAAIALVDVIDHQRLEIGGDRGPAQGAEFLAVDEHGRRRRLAGAGQRDADIGVLVFAGAVDDAAHHRDVERLDARIFGLPGRHLFADEIMDRARQ